MENLDNEQVAGEKIKILAINFKKFRWVELSRKGPDKMPSHYLPCNRRQPILLSAQHSLTISRFSRDLTRNIASKALRGVFNAEPCFPEIMRSLRQGKIRAPFIPACSFQNGMTGPLKRKTSNLYCRIFFCRSSVSVLKNFPANWLSWVPDKENLSFVNSMMVVRRCLPLMRIFLPSTR